MRIDSYSEHMKHILPLFILCLLALGAAPSQAQPAPWTEDGPNVQLLVHPEKSDVAPGETVRIAIEQFIRPEWHTYWRNPGDSGEPMRVRWNYNEAAPFTPQVTDLIWPTPVNLPFGPLLNYGYQDRAVIFQDVTLPDDMPDGAVSIPVAFDILVCQDICIPETIETTLELNNGQSQNPAFFEEARQNLPLQDHGFTASMSKHDDNIIIKLDTDLDPARLETATAQFYPYEYGVIAPAAAPTLKADGRTLVFTQKAGDFKFEDVKDKSGVFVIEIDGQRTGYQISPLTPTAAVTTPAAALPQAESDLQFVPALLLALLGGLVLNLMPCVFPVLSIKVLGLCKMSDKNRNEARLHGVAYTAGIVVSFMAIAGLLILLKSGGAQIGWGFQLQNPIVILLLGYLFFMIGLSLAGVFELGSNVMSLGQKWAERGGLSGSFFTGILASLVSTPCIAPFMGAAIGYALVQPAYISLIVFVALGVGLALPYLLISFIPSLQKALPRPGMWMVTFKEFLAFPMFATTAWLLWVLSRQEGSDVMFAALFGLVGLGLAAWLTGRSNSGSTEKQMVMKLGALVLILSSLFTATYSVQLVERYKNDPLPEYGQMFSNNALDKALESGKPVFVEMTADWCITCKLNHRVAIDTPRTRAVMKERDVIYLLGDWTNYDAEITAYLDKFGRKGVPIYVYYRAPDSVTGLRPEPELLPQLLLPGSVADTLTNP